jgi:hypothetical protein
VTDARGFIVFLVLALLGFTVLIYYANKESAAMNAACAAKNGEFINSGRYHRLCIDSEGRIIRLKPL